MWQRLSPYQVFENVRLAYSITGHGGPRWSRLSHTSVDNSLKIGYTEQICHGSGLL